MSEIDTVNKIRAVLRQQKREQERQKSAVLILSTGGTFDKIHDPITESLVFAENSHIESVLSEARVFHFRHQQIMMKDSLDLTDDDRDAIVAAVRDAPEHRIIITHGTSTMEHTAQYLNHSAYGEKTVVFTGAMRPYSLMNSDAGFNLGMAFGAVQALDNGVYITMNGRIFSAGSVHKNTTTGIFEDK